MNIKNTMLKMTTVIAVVFSFVACEDDFETVGGNVIGEPGFNASLYDEAELSTTNIDLSPVQTNNLPLNLLGVFTDPVFGDQAASIVTQVSLSATNPKFGNEPVIDSVILNIPYLSTQIGVDENGGAQYKIDSLYGENPIKLSVLESNYFLNSFDPETNFEQNQKYYSNLGAKIESNLTGVVLYENENFEPSSREVVEFENNDTLRYAPRMRLKLNTGLFQSKILNKEGDSELSSQENFRNFFRGIYLKAEKVGSDGSMVMLNLAQTEAVITLYYTTQEPDTGDVDGDDNTTELIDTPKSFKLSLGPARVNTFAQESPDFSGSDNLYLKGGEGNMAVIELFSGPDSDSDGVSDELEFLRDNNWLINEANLEFSVNRSLASDLHEPEHVYLYNLRDNIMLADYVFERSNQPNSMASLANNKHLVPLKTDDNGNGLSYKVRITRHINNILNNDSTNVKLGLVVTQNVNLINNSTVLDSEGAAVKKVPVGSVITPEATVLYGPNEADNEKRLKLNIYYTESK